MTEPASAKRASQAGSAGGGRVTVETVNVPGYTTTVDATRYHAMRHALRKVLPTQARSDPNRAARRPASAGLTRAFPRCR